jgi:DNA-binding NarL/FixJ family response regulator
VVDAVRAALLTEEPPSRSDPSRGDAAPNGPDLTPRERELLLLISTGATNREIARTLHLGPDSIKKNASMLYRKLGVRNRIEATRYASSLFGDDWA